MSKRGNDMSQLSKEEYDQAMESSNFDPSQPFAKASKEVLSRRKIFKATRRFKSPTPSTGNTSSGGSSASSNPFANGFSLVKPTTAAPAPAPSTSVTTGKPAFAMPSSAPAPSFSFATTKTTTTTTTTDSKESQDLLKAFKTFIQKQDPRTEMSQAMSSFINTYMHLKDGGSSGDNNKENKSGLGGTPSTESTSGQDKPLFPSVTNAPAPVPFTFASTTTSSSMERATSGSSGFSFSSGSSAPTPAPAPSPKSDTAPTAISTVSEKKDESPALESADGDWKLVYTIRAKVYHYRGKEATKFALGDLKLQEHKEDKKSKRMVMRDIAGKVLLNVGIAKGMDFSKHVTKKHATTTFMGVMDADRGAEMFTIACKQVNIDDLVNKLKEMAS